MNGMLSLPQILFLQCLLDITHGKVTMFWQGLLPPEKLQDMLGRYKDDSCIWSPLLLHRHLWSSSSTLPACISDLSPKPMASAFSIPFLLLGIGLWILVSILCIWTQPPYWTLCFLSVLLYYRTLLGTSYWFELFEFYLFAGSFSSKLPDSILTLDLVIFLSSRHPTPHCPDHQHRETTLVQHSSPSWLQLIRLIFLPPNIQDWQKESFEENIKF